MSDQDARMETLLRQALSAHPPQLSTAFDRRLAARLGPARPRHGARLIFALYILMAVTMSGVAILQVPPVYQAPLAVAVTAALLALAWIAHSLGVRRAPRIGTARSHRATK